MTETIKRFVREIAHFSDETLIITLSILILVLVILVVYWHYNKKKFHQLSHQIPASVLKSYLDSIIQNSTSLKSSLFRGGGLDIGDGIPSVVPVGSLPSGNITVGDSSEELNQKIAECSSLTQRLADKDRQITELDSKLRDAQAASLSSGGGDNSEEVAILQAEIEKLRAEIEALKNAAPVASGGDEALAGQLADVTKERDELKERLMEYEIIEEDLANLKRLQQENDELKKTIAELQAGGSAPAAEAPAEPEAAAPEPEPVAEPVAEEISEAAPEESPEGGEDLEAQMAAAITDTPPAEEEAPAEDGVPTNEGEQKSAEELLSEFEKMLG